MPRPRFEHLPSERRLEIIEAAMVEFARKGYEGASLNRIIAQAGLSKGATYYYFDGKEDLFIVVVQTALQQVINAVGELEEEGSGAGDFWTAVGKICRKMMLFFIAHPTLAALVRTLAALPRPAGADIALLYDQGRGFAEALIRSGQAQGAVRADLPFDLLSCAVMAIFQAVDQWATLRWDELGEDDVAELSAVAVDLLRRLVSPP